LWVITVVRRTHLQASKQRSKSPAAELSPFRPRAIIGAMEFEHPSNWAITVGGGAHRAAGW